MICSVAALSESLPDVVYSFQNGPNMPLAVMDRAVVITLPELIYPGFKVLLFYLKEKMSFKLKDFPAVVTLCLPKAYGKARVSCNAECIFILDEIKKSMKKTYEYSEFPFLNICRHDWLSISGLQGFYWSFVYRIYNQALWNWVTHVETLQAGGSQRTLGNKGNFSVPK